MRRLFAALVLLFVAAGCVPPLRRPRVPPPPATPPRAPGHQVPGAPGARAPEPVRPAAAYAGRGAPATWAAARAALALAPLQQRAALAQDWLQTVQRRGAPLWEGDRALFFHGGPARRVEVTGDWTRWAAVPLAPVPGTDLWVREEALPANAVLGYRLIVDGQVRADPLNPRTSRAMNADWSVFLGPAAPGQEPPAQPAPGQRHTLAVASAALGRPVTVTVHVPPACTAAAPCPVLYAADGPFYLAEGRVTETAAALAASGRIPWLVVVGVAPPPNPILRTLELLPGLRGEIWSRFLAGELAPAIEAAFPVRRDRGGRVLLGQSAGAAAMLAAALRNPQAWGRAVIQSPASLPPALEEAVAAFRGPPVRLWLTWGTWEGNVFGLDVTADTARLAARLREQGLSPGGGERPGGHTMALWRRDLAPALAWLFSDPGRAAE